MYCTYEGKNAGCENEYNDRNVYEKQALVMNMKWWWWEIYSTYIVKNNKIRRKVDKKLGGIQNKWTNWKHSSATIWLIWLTLFLNLYIHWYEGYTI